jgi:hypothetical protein
LLYYNSNIGKEDHRTRIEYKNKHKRQIFEEMKNIAASLNISGMIVEAAQKE